MIGICPSFIVEMKKKIKEPTKAVKPFFFWGGGGEEADFVFVLVKSMSVFTKICQGVAFAVASVTG